MRNKGGRKGLQPLQLNCSYTPCMQSTLTLTGTRVRYKRRSVAAAHERQLRGREGGEAVTSLNHTHTHTRQQNGNREWKGW